MLVLFPLFLAAAQASNVSQPQDTIPFSCELDTKELKWCEFTPEVSGTYYFVAVYQTDKTGEDNWGKVEVQISGNENEYASCTAGSGGPGVSEARTPCMVKLHKGSRVRVVMATSRYHSRTFASDFYLTAQR